MKLVFCGTPEFAVPTLDAVLAAGHEVALVVTQPDRPAGRGLTVQVSPVKARATERGLPTVQPERVKKNEDLRSSLEAIAPDAILVVKLGTPFHDWAWSDEKIAAARADYVFFARNDDKDWPAEIWVRRDALGLRAEQGAP